jgi:hypothetical protein
MALVPQTQELQREVENVHQLRRALHDAYIVEAALGRRSAKDASKPPSAMEVHRTLDAPTLNVLKSPNYPFTLCEEAPPSYVPPPVPYDVEGEIDSLKQRVLQVQEDFQNYQKQHSRSGAPLSQSQVLDFFGRNATYAEMAWEVSSLQWFYRWVLSHSISHLWNCKEQLEYVLTENNQELPQSAEEMDLCLQELPFSAAVSVLDTDRQCVVAQERRRLRSISRTFRDGLPVEAVTAATSSYLTPEEKYMYQEFFNQSEHMLLLLNHTLMLNKANSNLVQGSHNHTSQNSAAGLLSNAQISGRGGSLDSGAVVVATDSMLGEMDTAGLAEETLSAVSAEQEVIMTLMKTIRERQQRDECFDVSAAEYQHSRKAQIAVYGCVLSDMSLMGQQMGLVAEFIERYEDWLKLRGFQTHEQLMSELSKRSGGTAWPMLRGYGEYGSEDTHTHFVPPTEEMMARCPRPSDGHGPRDDTYTQFDSAKNPRAPLTNQNLLTKPPAPARRTPPSAASGEPAPASKAPPTTAPISSTASVRSAPSKGGQKPPAVSGAVTLPASNDAAAPRLERASSEIAHAFYGILEQTAAACPKASDGVVARAWLTACVRFTVVKILRREWDIGNTAKNIAQAEEELLGMLRRNGAYSRLTATAAALCVVTQEVARLCVARCEMRSLTVEVPVVVHVPEDADDYAQAVADVMNPVEEERWSSVLDALWFQADPSGLASGGLLLQKPAAAAAGGAMPASARPNKKSQLHFLCIEAIDAPPTPQNRCVAAIRLRYRLPRMSPETTTSRRAAPALAAVSEAQPSSNHGMARYQLARHVLAALFEIEAKGLLPCFACRVSEAATVPLSQAMFVTFDDTNTSVVVDKSHVPSLCVLPPAAIELKRLYADVGAAPAPEGPDDEHYTSYSVPVHFSTIGLMVATVLEDMAIRVPVLNDLYMTASTVREQALWEVQNGASSKCFVNATTHPIPVSCAPAKTRAISIQRESVTNRNSTAAVRRFISPLLRHVDDRIALLEFGGGGSSTVAGRSNHTSVNPEGSISSPRGPPPPQQSVTGRQTQMVAGNNGAASPSPSAVRPNRR